MGWQLQTGQFCSISTRSGNHMNYTVLVKTKALLLTFCGSDWWFVDCVWLSCVIGRKYRYVIGLN